MRNFIFGVEDSLVSTVGLLSGIAVAGISRAEIFVAVSVLICVEAFSMGVGSYLTEHSVEEYESNGHEPSSDKSIPGAVVMFFSYFLAGFIPLLPYLALEVENALVISIALSLISLFVLGIVSATISKTGILKHGIRMLSIGGLAILGGVIVGRVLSLG